MHLSFIPVQFLLLILVGSLVIASDSSNSLARHHFRAKRQNDGITTMLINAVKSFILGGGVESIRGNSDKMGALQKFVSNYAVRSVLGDGLVGQVLGRGLGVAKQPSIGSSSGGGGFLSKLMGNKGSDSTSSGGDSSGSSGSGSGGSFLGKLFSSVTGGGAAAAPAPTQSSNSGSLASLAAKFLG